MIIANCVFVLSLSTTLVLLLYSPGVEGSHYCSSTSVWGQGTYCDDNSYCCGTYDTDCCSKIVYSDSSSQQNSAAMEVFALLIVLIVLICCPVMCYRCCCKRTASRGIIYSQPGTTTAVTVSLPPQQNQVPYPTVVPYPQQTPYPPQQPQYPNNPYYGVPPPAYGIATQQGAPQMGVQQAGVQQASAPSAPPFFQS